MIVASVAAPRRSAEGQSALDIARENGNEQALKIISAATEKVTAH
jgi:hypothetical protein